jgi:hypothetical protein
MSWRGRAAALGAVTWVLGCSGAATPLPPPAPPQARQAADPSVPGPLVRDLLGINEAVSIPRRLAATAPAAARNAHLDQDAAWTTALGVRQVRVHTANFPYLSYDRQAGRDPAELDAFLGRLLAAGLQPLVMIGPWPGNETAAATDHYLPDDLAAYEAWVQHVVERYDGDGVDDAPGIGSGVRAWEVDNEPDLHHAAPPRGNRAGPKPDRTAPSDFCTPEEFARLAVLTAAAIRDADPTAMVLPGGLIRLADPAGRAYAQALWADPQFAASFDAISVHRYPEGPGVAAAWDAVAIAEQIAPGRRVWLTEVSTPSTDSADRTSERTQADDLVALFMGALQRDLGRVYWHALVEGADYYGRGGLGMARGRHLLVGRPEDLVPGPTGGWRAVHRKLSAWALARLLETLGDAPRAEASFVDAAGAQAVVWSDRALVSGTGGTVALALPFTGPVEAIALLPDGADGASVSDPPVFRHATVAPSDDRTYAIDLSAGPVVVRPVSR